MAIGGAIIAFEIGKDVMDTGKKKTSFSFGVFMLAVALLALNLILYGTGLYSGAKQAVRIASAVMLGLVFLLNFRKIRCSRGEVLMLLFLIVLVFVHGAEALNLILVFLALLDARTFEKRAIVRYMVAIAVVTIVVLLALLLSHRITDYSYVFDGRARSTMGFSNPNQAALFFASLMIFPLVSRRKTAAMIVVTAILVVVYIYTNTRSLLLSTAVYFVAYFVFSRLISKKKQGAIQALLLLLMAIPLVSSFALTLFSGTELDYLLSYRPSDYASFFASLDPLEWLFGTDVVPRLDSFYITTVATYGVIVLSYLVFKIGYYAVKLSNKADASTLALYCAVLMYAIFESFLLRPEFLLTVAFWFLIDGDRVSSMEVFRSKSHVENTRMVR